MYFYTNAQMFLHKNDRKKITSPFRGEVEEGSSLFVSSEDTEEIEEQVDEVEIEG